MEQTTELQEKPQNGLAGLKHWRNDLASGLVVSLISLPFSLGIAIASGAPPITGIVSAIVAGMIMPFLGGSFVTVSGPAAGLAPVLLSSMLTLGAGNKEVGYPLVLACIVTAGVVQLILAKFKLARLAQIFPASVVEGMLCAIGLMIIAKQLPMLLGRKFHAKSFWGILAEAPSQISQADHKVVGVGLASLVLIFGLVQLEKRIKWIPVAAPIVTAVFGLCLSVGLNLDAQYRIQLPNFWANPMGSFTLPNFKGIMDGNLWLPAIGVVVLLTLINGVESLATITAIDKKDPFKRKSDSNRTLFAMGIANIASASVGGLTIIPGGVKSGANIVAGGRTLWSNIYNAMFLIVYVTIGQSLVNYLPLGTLGAIVVLMGWKFCKPAVWVHVAKIGKEQIGIFMLTVFVTVTEDLLLGIIAGIVAKLVVVLVQAKRTEGGRKLSTWKVFTSLFKNPVREVDAGISYKEDGDYEIVLNGPVTCFNSAHLQRAFEKVPHDVPLVIVTCDPGTMLIMDHTSAANIESFKDYFEGRGHRGKVELLICDGMELLSSHPHSMRVPSNPPTPPKNEPPPPPPPIVPSPSPSRSMRGKKDFPSGVSPADGE